MVTPNFPPFAMAGAARTGALARYWAAQGVNVHVLSARNDDVQGLHDALDDDHISAEFLPIAQDGATDQPRTKQVAAAHSSTIRKDPGPLRRLVWGLRALPDRYHPHWTARAAQRGAAIAAEQPIDLIYSSGPPHSVHIAAAAIKQATGLPWICEQRDLWVGNPFADRPWITETLNKRLSNNALPLATAFVGVTQGTVAELESQYDAPVVLAYNGLDPVDFAGVDSAQEPEPLDADKLTIVHPGVIYAEKRDPGPLFAAIASLAHDVRQSIHMIFFHDEYDYIMDMAKAHGVTDQIEFRPMIPRHEVLALERQADLLLLAHWDDPRGDAIIPGKVFEYIGARRPIIATGSPNSEVAQIVRKGNFGLSGAAPQEIAAHLIYWLEEKRKAGGRVPDLPAKPIADFTRDRQFAKIDTLITRVLGRGAA